MHTMTHGTADSRDPALEERIQTATRALLDRQKPDGHWVFELEADSTIPAEYILMRHYLAEPVDAELERKIGVYLRRVQGAHGGWPLFHEGAFDMSASVKAYYALKLIGDSPDAEHMRRAREAIRARGGAAFANVFTPIGVQAGAFLLKPAVDVTGAYDTNPARAADARASWYAVMAPELLVNSNWSRHELTANLRGSHTSYENASDLNRPSADAKVNGRVDVTPWTRLDLEGRFLLGTDNPGSPNIQVGLAKLPIFTTLGGSAGVAQRFNRFEVALKGGADRTVYQDSRFTDGTTGSNADRDYNRYLSQLRLSYELTPGVKPFVETGADRRVHDIAVDRNGVARNSDGWYGKGGTSFELSPLLTGEVAAGTINRSYRDPTLPDISGATFDSSLTWLASALTTVKLTATTRVDESTLVGVSGVFTREVALQVDHAFRRWLVATLKLTRATDDYVGSPREDERYAASALLTYKLTREVWLKTEYRREWLRSNEPGNDYAANVVLFGLRLQR